MEPATARGLFSESLASQALYTSRNLARLLSLSQRQLQRAYRSRLGVSPQKWLITQRVNRAKLLLVQGKRVKAIADELGYAHVSHFSLQFKTETGFTPSAFALRKKPVAKV